MDANNASTSVSIDPQKNDDQVKYILLVHLGQCSYKNSIDLFNHAMDQMYHFITSYKS